MNPINSYASSKLHTLFGNQSFINLKNIHFNSVHFQTIVELVNLPSLQRLDLWNCTHPPDRPGLVLPQNFLVWTLFLIVDVADEISPLLTRIKGLENLLLRVNQNERIWWTESTQRELARAIEVHKGSLWKLRVQEYLIDHADGLWDMEFVSRILECKQLYRLCLLQVRAKPFYYYLYLIEQLPNLRGLVIYNSEKWTETRTSSSLPNKVIASLLPSSKLSLLGFSSGEWDTYARPDPENCFIRRGMDLKYICVIYRPSWERKWSRFGSHKGY